MKTTHYMMLAALWAIGLAGPLVAQPTRSTLDLLHEQNTVGVASHTSDRQEQSGAKSADIKCNVQGAVDVAKDCMLGNGSAFDRTAAGSIGTHLHALACAKHPMEAIGVVQSFGKAIDACKSKDTANCLLQAALAAKSATSYGSGLCDCAGLSGLPLCRVLKISDGVLSPVARAQCISTAVHFVGACTARSADNKCARALASHAPPATKVEAPANKPSSPPTPKPPSRNDKPGRPGPLNVT